MLTQDGSRGEEHSRDGGRWGRTVTTVFSRVKEQGKHEEAAASNTGDLGYQVRIFPNLWF